MYHVKIITLNLYGVPFSNLSARLDKICETINSSNADIINLQQVHTYDVVWRLRRRLPEFASVSYVPSLVGPLGGLLTLSKRKINNRTFWQANQASKLLGVNVKGAILMELETGLFICNVHLSANTDGDWTSSSKFYGMHKRQLAGLGDFIRTHTGSASPVLLTGDFNVAKDSSLFEAFVRKNGFFDTSNEDLRPTFHKEFLPEGEPGRRIDHILLRNTHSFRITASSRLFEHKVMLRNGKRSFLSDHFGLCSRIEMRLP